MDYNEVLRGFKYRHPWEISRTYCLYKCWDKYIKKFVDGKSINIGAGDCYFDQKMIKEYGYKLMAVDIAYPKAMLGQKGNINFVDSIEACSEKYDCAFMMDSLEYMDDDVGYISMLSKFVKKGGYIFLTLPANKALFSAHDILVGNKRRYDESDIDRIINENENLQVIEKDYFYFMLYVIRIIQCKLGMKADEKVTTGWRWSYNNIITKIFDLMLRVDFNICRILKIKGLSLMVVIKVNG